MRVYNVPFVHSEVQECLCDHDAIQQDVEDAADKDGAITITCDERSAFLIVRQDTHVSTAGEDITSIVKMIVRKVYQSYECVYKVAGEVSLEGVTRRGMEGERERRGGCGQAPTQTCHGLYISAL